MSYVPMGCAAVAFIALLLIRRRRSEYVEIPNEDSSSALKGDRCPTNYGSINADSAQTSTDSETNYGSINACVIDDNNRDSNHIQPAASELSNGCSISPCKPSFIVGSTPDPSSHSST